MADPKPEPSMKGADGLRTLACLMVVFHHLSQQLTFNPSIEAPPVIRAIAEFFTSSGSVGVSVFFVLSGFLLAVPFWRSYFEGRNLPSLRVYAARRAGRIMPGFYLNLLFFFLIAALFTPEAPALLWRYFAGLTFTSGFHVVTFFPAEGNGPLWSIGFEVVSYVLLPLGMAGLFALFGKKRSAAAALGWWAAVWLLVLAVHQAIQTLFAVGDLGKGWQEGLIGGAQFWMPRYNPIGFFGHFALGTIAAGVAVLWARSTRPKRPLRFDAACLALTAAWVFILVSRTNQDQFSWTLGGQPYYFPLFAGTTAALLACLTQSRWAARVFDNPFTGFTARASFGLYLWHTLVITGFNGALGDTFEWLLLVAVTLAGSYAVAALSWKFFEEPILRRVQAWKPGTASRRGILLVAGAAAFLVTVPLLVSAARPSVWNLPTTAGAVFAFNQPGAITGLADDGEGGWYAAFDSAVYRVAADKTYRRLYTVPEKPAEIRLTFDKPLHQPLAMAEPGLIVLKPDQPFLWNVRLGPDGNLYVAAGDRVVVLSPDGRELKTYRFPRRGDFGVMDVAFAGGAFYVPDGSVVYRVDASGQARVFLENASFTKAAGVVIAQGRLWITDFDHRRPEAGRILSFSLKKDEPGEPESFAAPGALFGVEHGGAVSFSRAFTSWIYRWDGALHKLWYPNLKQIGSLTARGETVFTGGWDGVIGETEVRR